MLFTTMILATCGSLASASEEKQKKINYFETASHEQTNTLLRELKINSCQSFVSQYLESKKEDLQTITIQALAYDGAICTAQNLPKAEKLYQKSFSLAPIFPNLPLRLALIYAYGPSELRDINAAIFLYKQTALDLIVIKDPALKQKIINKHLNHKPMPPELETQMIWIEDIFKKPADERELIAHQLEKEGFKNTNFIWPLSEDFQNLNIKGN